MSHEDIRAAATALGKLGARKGGLARAKKMPPEERSRQARDAVRARWRRVRQAAADSGGSPPGAAPA
jgi:hypothetical protein